MEEQFLVQGKSTGAKMTFTFTDGMLTAYEFQGEMSRKQYTWLVNYFPFTLEMIEWMRRQKGFIVSQVVKDLSFKAFWDTYNYKVGNKQRSERLWNKLQEMERIIAMNSIRRYDSYLKMHPNIEKLYPETYLNQKRYENEFK